MKIDRGILTGKILQEQQTAQRLKKVEMLVTRRLMQNKGPVNLCTYEGTVLDRLALYFVRQTWSLKEYQVVCSIRPCMHPKLIEEVQSFARKNDCLLVGFEGDCSARHPWESSTPRSCENISRYIYKYLKGTKGLLLSSALINATTNSDFSKVNQEYENLYTFESDALAAYRRSSQDKNWKTLFLFESLLPIDIVSAFLFFVSPELEIHHIPLCYLDCYNEQELRKLIELVTPDK